MHTHKQSVDIASALDRCEYSTLGAVHFVRRNRVHVPHRTGDWVGPRLGLESLKEKNVLNP
jgi:hypothetical protein